MNPPVADPQCSGEVRQCKSRETKDGPWAWQHKEAWRLLASGYGESMGHAAASARSVYLALTELASDTQCERFQASKQTIAHRAFVSTRTVTNVLIRLEALKLVGIERQSSTGRGRPDLPSYYTIIGVGNGCLPRRQRLPTRRQMESCASFADKEEESGRIPEEIMKKGGIITYES